MLKGETIPGEGHDGKWSCSGVFSKTLTIRRECFCNAFRLVLHKGSVLGQSDGWQ